MMICSKCGIEKDESNYYKYFHSTQNKWRVRKECNECHKKTRLKRKNPELYYQSNPNYKKCTTCNNWKTIEEYYFQSKSKDIRFNECIACTKEKDKLQRIEYLKENGGSNVVISEPNKYSDEYQKEQIFFVLKLLGYTYNEENGVWLKPGFKELIDGQIVFPNLKEKKRGGYYQSKVSLEKIEKIVEYKRRGWNNQKIADKLGISDTTVYKYYSKWKDTSK